MKLKWSSCLLWGACAVAVSCGPPSNKPTKTITLGAVIDLASTTAWSGWPPAGELAIEQLNTALSQAGSEVRFKLSVSDSAQSASTSTTRALALRDEGAKAIISDTSSNGVAITKLMYDADTGNDLNLPVLCVTCTAPGLNNPAANGVDAVDTATLRDADGWNFRTVNRGTEQTLVLRNVITARGTQGDVNADAKFKLSIIVLNDSSGHGYVKSTRDTFAAVAPNVIVEKVVVDGANLDVNNNALWDGLAQKLIDTNTDCPQDPANANACLAASLGDGLPDALMENLNPGYNIALSQALSRAANSIGFFHAHAFRARQISDSLRSAINGQFGVSAVLYENDASGLQFAADVKAKTGFDPALLEANMYDATVTLALAAFKASRGLDDPTAVTGAQVRDALKQLNDPSGELFRVGAGEFKRAVDKISAGQPINYQGASGPVDFDDNGNVRVNLSLYKGENGAFVDVARFNCVTDLATCPQAN